MLLEVTAPPRQWPKLKRLGGQSHLVIFGFGSIKDEVDQGKPGLGGEDWAFMFVGHSGSTAFFGAIAVRAMAALVGVRILWGRA